MGDVIIGAGISGLTAAQLSGFPVFEAKSYPGGDCVTYYSKVGEETFSRLPSREQEDYRFEVGGGHWINGAGKRVNSFLNKFSLFNVYKRRSSVYFKDQDIFVSYPLQDNVRFLGCEIAERFQKEVKNRTKNVNSMKDWLHSNFGPTLCELFFFPFHNLYTAGLYTKVSPQDYYKSPLSSSDGKFRTRSNSLTSGYNSIFLYPSNGFSFLANRMAEKCDISYNKALVKVDTKNRIAYFSDGDSFNYRNLISTVPLNEMIRITGLDTGIKSDPYNSVLLLNIGAVRGERCPEDHWLYIPDSVSGFYRVGFYSNVDRSFLPISQRKRGERVGVYVERAYMPGCMPSERSIKRYKISVIKELQDWGFISGVEIVDANWINVAYPRSWMCSQWREKSLNLLKDNGIYQIGRYACWNTQGISASMMDAFCWYDNLK